MFLWSQNKVWEIDISKDPANYNLFPCKLQPPGSRREEKGKKRNWKYSKEIS